MALILTAGMAAEQIAGETAFKVTSGLGLPEMVVQLIVGISKFLGGLVGSLSLAVFFAPFLDFLPFQGMKNFVVGFGIVFVLVVEIVIFIPPLLPLTVPIAFVAALVAAVFAGLFGVVADILSVIKL